MNHQSTQGQLGQSSLDTQSSTADAPEVEPHQPERRQVTVMLCDLVGSTELSHRLDPEDLRELIRAYQVASTAVITHYGGFIGRYMGDGILAHFGYPQAHENDPERAVHAGLGAVQAIAELSRQVTQNTPHGLAIRVGIATGLVVAGDVIGEGVAEEQAVVGLTPNLAARLQHLAEPNTVVIGSSTYRLIKGLFECENLGTHALKGLADDVQAWRVIQPRSTGSRFEALHGTRLTPLVGREEEIELLLRRWQQAKQGEGQVVLLWGEAGIGKSRIAHALCERVATEAHTQLRYQCSPFHTNSTLYPIISHIDRAAKFGPRDTPQKKLAKLRALMAKSAKQVEETVPLIAALLSIPTEGCFPSINLSPQQQKMRTLAALIEQMEGLAMHELVLVVLEDAQWMDPTTRELLDLSVQRAQDARALIIVTFRSDVLPPWSEHAHVRLLALNRLSQRQSAELVHHVAGSQMLPKELVTQIVAKTDGVPLFIEELTKTLLSSGLVQNKTDRFVLNSPVMPLAIPTTLQDSLMARLDQLSPVKRVAQIGAAIGREFSYELLAAVSELSEAELVSALTQLAQAELIIQRGLPPEAHYSFKHALVQDAAYESLLKSTRHELHARIAHVLETQFAQAVELEPELLAHHHALAGFFERAMMYLRRAGQQALARSSNLEAIGYAKRGLDILSHLPDIPGHAKQELALQLILGAAYRVTKGFASAEVEQTFKRAKRLCEQVVDTPPACTDTLKGLYACYYVRGALSAAQTQADQILTSACHTGNRQHVMTGRYLRGASLFWQGAFVAARRELDEAISLCDPREQHINPLSVQLDPGTNALNHMAWTLWMLGYPDQGQRASDEALARARQLSQPLTLAMTLFWACTTHSCCGRYPVAQGLLSELKAIANEHHFTYLSIISGVLESQLLLANEQLADAQATIERALDEMQAQRAELGWPWAASVAVNVCRRTGNTQQGLMLLTKALEMVERHGEHHWEAELYRLKGELLLAMATTQTTDAKACLSHALEIARTQSAKSLELRAALSLAHLGQRSGENQAASGILSDIYCWFSEGCETVDLTRAKSLLAQLKRQTNVPPMPQELQASGVGSAGDMRNTH